MKRTQEIKKTYPELNQSKITENKSDKKNIRSTGGTGKDIFITGKDGSKITQLHKEEKFKETQKQRNYIMYKPVREPEDRVEKTNIQTIKKKEYLDNHQYKEIKVITNKNQRLGDFIGKKFEEPSYDEKKVFSKGSNCPQLTEETKATKANTKIGPAIPENLKGNKSNIMNEESGEFIVR